MASSSAGDRGSLAVLTDDEADQQTLLEIYVQAHDLVNLDRMSLSDPMCVLYIWSPDSGGWIELGRSEEVRDSLHPRWKTTFLVPYHPTRKLRFVLYDIDVHSTDLDKQDLIGEVVCTVSELHDAPRHVLSRRITYLPRPSALRGTLVAVSVTIAEDHDLTSIERMAILKRLHGYVDESNESVSSFPGSLAVRFMANEVISFKDDHGGARNELGLFVAFGYLLPVTTASGDSVSKPAAFNPASSRIEFSLDGRFAINPYFLTTTFASNVMAPQSAVVADAERAMHASRHVFVDEVERDHFLPPELRDQPDVRFGKLEPGKDVPPVIAASLDKLVELITYAKASNMDLLHSVILTYQSYTTSEQFLAALINRFQVGGTLTHESEADVVMIKFRVLNAMKLWVTTGYVDFYDNNELQSSLLEFLKGIAGETSSPALAKLSAAVIAAYDKAFAGKTLRGGEYFEDGQARDHSPPPPLVAADFTGVTRLVDVDPVEIARQLTLMEHGAYCRVRITELMGCAWSKGDAAKELAPNVLDSIRQFNGVSCLFRDTIVRAQTPQERAEIIEYALQVADAAASLNNWSSVMAIVASLSATPIHRLKKTWTIVNTNKKMTRLREQLESMISAQGNFRTYRKLLNKCDPPAVPYLGVWLSDLTFLEDGNADTLDDGLINFSKFTLVASVLSSVRQYQLLRYQLVPVDAIQAFLRKQLDAAMDEEEAYRLSLQVEPRDRPTPDVNQLADENIELKDQVRALNRKISVMEIGQQRMENELSSMASMLSQLRAQMIELVAAGHGNGSDGAGAKTAGGDGDGSDGTGTGVARSSTLRGDEAFLRIADRHHNRTSQAALIESVHTDSGAESADGSEAGTGSSAGGDGDGGAANDGGAAGGNAAGSSSSSGGGKSKGMTHSGFLYKQSGAKASKWQKRWFVLRDGHLAYYKSAKGNASPAGVIVLHGCDIREVPKATYKKDFVFEVHHEQRRTYRMYAANEMERTEWVGILSSQTE